MEKIYPIDSVGIMLTYKCPLGCKHCLYACGPKWKEFMKIETLSSILQSIKRLWKNYRPNPSKNILFHGIHFAGGEPFLNFPLLLSAVRIAKEFGVYMGYVETNAEWCIDKEDVYEKFSLLKDSGLPRIFISCSPFHAEKVPLKRTLLAIEVAQRVLGPENVIIYMAHFIKEIAKFDIENPVPLDRWESNYGKKGAGYIFWEGYGLISGGRSGFLLGDLWYKYPPEVFREDTCRFEILKSQHAHFDPYGNYIPYFCGGISLGSCKDLGEFYNNFNLDKLPLIKILVERGPYGLMRFAEELGFEGYSEGYVGKCHLCVHVRKFLVQKTNKFLELFPQDFYNFLNVD